MNAESVVAVFGSRGDAEEAILYLQRGGFPLGQVSLIAKHLQSDEQEAVSHGDQTERRAAVGAATGGALGLLAGSAFLALPGVGPLLLVGAVVTGFTGAIVGGLVGAMSGWGIPAEHARHYEELLRQGRIIVMVHGNPEELAEADRLLAEVEPVELHLHEGISADDRHIAAQD